MLKGAIQMSLQEACRIIYEEDAGLAEAIHAVKYYNENILDLEDHEVDTLSEVITYLIKKGWY